MKTYCILSFLFLSFLNVLGQENLNYKKHEIILATYKNIDEILQFRKNENGVMNVYDLTEGKEQWLTGIENKNLTKEQAHYLFLFNLCLSKSETLLNFGTIKGKNIDIFMEKTEQSSPKIKIYSSENHEEPLEIFNDIEAAFQSPYFNLLVK